MQGLILNGTKNVFEVECDDGITRNCAIKGKVLKSGEKYYNPLAPGDVVVLDSDSIEEHKALICDLVPRKNEFVRWNVKKRQPQILASNLDYLLIVTTPDEPPFRPRFIDRALAQAEYENIEPIIVCNKYDLVSGQGMAGVEDARFAEDARFTENFSGGAEDARLTENFAGGAENSRWAEEFSGGAEDARWEEEFSGATEVLARNRQSAGATGACRREERAEQFERQLQIWESVGYRVIRSSARTGEGIEELAHLIENKLSAFVGQSGVGKSSIINVLDNNVVLKTGSLSQKYGKGCHTTTKGSLIHLNLDEALVGGRKGATANIIDTPGVRRFLLHNISPENLAFYFRDFKPFLGKCSFGMSCSHIQEKNCAIKAAVQSGKIAPERYESWLRILEEMKSGDFE